MLPEMPKRVVWLLAPRLVVQLSPATGRRPHTLHRQAARDITLLCCMARKLKNDNPKVLSHPRPGAPGYALARPNL